MDTTEAHDSRPHHASRDVVPWRRIARMRVVAGTGLVYSKGKGAAATLFPLFNGWKRAARRRASLLPSKHSTLKEAHQVRVIVS